MEQSNSKEVCAILSFVFMILGIFLLGIPFELAGLILGIFGTKSSKPLNILSAVSLVLSAILLVVCLMSFAIIASR